MKIVAIGGNSRSVGKTSLAVSIIAATKELGWTAVKITQFGHGVCSRNGQPCGCAVEDPLCPYEIGVEDGENPSTDTARMLAAGADEVFWMRTALGNLVEALARAATKLGGPDTRALRIEQLGRALASRFVSVRLGLQHAGLQGQCAAPRALG